MRSSSATHSAFLRIPLRWSRCSGRLLRRVLGESPDERRSTGPDVAQLIASIDCAAQNRPIRKEGAMSLHRMDFLVSDHQSSLMREADGHRLANSLGNGRSRSRGAWSSPMMHVMLHTVWHDLRTHHIHRHHPHGHPHPA